MDKRFVYTKCRFNPLTDRKEVFAGQSIDVVECIRTGTVLPAAKESLSNALDDISKVGKRVHDVFDALEASGMIAKAMSSVSNSEESNT